jgi:hypothetical protein
MGKTIATLYNSIYVVQDTPCVKYSSTYMFMYHIYTIQQS